MIVRCLRFVDTNTASGKMLRTYASNLSLMLILKLI